LTSVFTENLEEESMSLQSVGRCTVGGLLLLGASYLTPDVVAQAGKAAGKVSVDANAIAIASVTAVGYKSTMGQLVSILLTDKPADDKSFAADLRGIPANEMVPGLISGAWKSQHFGKRFSGLTFTISSDGKILDNELLVGGKNETFSLSSDEFVVELTSKSPRIAGRVRTKTPIVDVGKKVSVDVTFDAPVSAPPK
jgi:hypothetical protein